MIILNNSRLDKSDELSSSENINETTSAIIAQYHVFIEKGLLQK